MLDHHRYQPPPSLPSNNLTGIRNNSFYTTAVAPQDHGVAKQSARDTACKQPNPVESITNKLSEIDLGMTKEAQVPKENHLQPANQNDQKVQSWADIASKPAKTAVAEGKENQVAKQ